MIFTHLTGRAALTVRLIGLALISWTVFRASHHAPSASGRGLVISVTFALCVVAWLAWMSRPVPDRGITPEVWVLAAAGGILCGASPGSAASAFVFVAVVAAGLRAELSRAFLVVGVGILALALSVLVYDGSALGLLAYSLGFAAATLAGANARQAAAKTEQAELLLAQSQRSHEEQLRAARLQESTRIAREIHDVLAHALAGLTIQLEATSALVDQGADPAAIKARLDRAHALAHEGLRETRRAVGALRSEPIAAQAGIEALVEEYRAADGAAELTIDGDPGRLAGPVGEAVLRVVQESLTNVRKHAPGASVSVALHAGDLADGDVVLVVDDHPSARAHAPSPLAATGGGYGSRACANGPRLSAALSPRGPVGMVGGSNCGFRFSSGLRARARRRRGCVRLRPEDPIVSDPPIRVLVADDQALVREGLMTLLALAVGIEPVAAAADGEEAVALAARHRPHVVLMDLRMPRLDGAATPC